MTQRAFVLALLGLATLTACHKKPPEVAATPSQPTSSAPSSDQAARDSAAAARERQRIADSIAAANAARNSEASRAELVNRLADAVHFEYDQDAILEGDMPRMADKASIMRANPALKIRITGHCDERGSREYNLALGMRRATAAKDYLVRTGIDASRIEVASLGSEVPVDPASSESAWAKNRRDEFEITSGGQTLVAPR